MLIVDPFVYLFIIWLEYEFHENKNCLFTTVLQTPRTKPGKSSICCIKEWEKKVSLLPLQLVGYRSGTLAVPGVGGTSHGGRGVSVKLQSTEGTVRPYCQGRKKGIV